MIDILIRRNPGIDRDTQGRQSCEDGGRDWSDDASTSQGIPRINDKLRERNEIGSPSEAA